MLKSPQESNLNAQNDSTTKNENDKTSVSDKKTDSTNTINIDTSFNPKNSSNNVPNAESLYPLLFT